MISSEIQHYLDLADESHEVAGTLIKLRHIRFSAAQSYYTIFYAAAYGKEFAKTGLLDPKFHRYILDAQERRLVGHYGSEHEEVTDEEALESFQWAGEFMEAVKAYLSNL